MTMEPEFLQSLDESTPPLGLQIGDPELDSMREMADAEDFEGLLALASELAERGIFDIRAVLYGIYAGMRTGGLLTTEDLFLCLITLLKEKWPGVGPEEKRNAYAKGSFAWLFTCIRVELQRVELEAGEEWSFWLENFRRENLTSLISTVSNLNHAIREVIGDEYAGDANSKLTEIGKWLSELGQKLREPAAADAPEAEVETGNAPTALKPQFGSVGGSVHLEILVQKLALFEQVMEQGDMAKAAVIVADITEIIDQFDPRLYLPSLFSKFFALLTPRINEVYEMMEMRESPQFSSLQSLYRVDMEAFLNLDLNS